MSSVLPRPAGLFGKTGAGLTFKAALFDFSCKPVPPNVRAGFILKSSWWLRGSRCLSSSLPLKCVNVLCAAISMETGIGSAETAQGLPNCFLKTKSG